MTSLSTQQKPRVLILYTGGTFGMSRQLKTPRLTSSILKKQFLQRVPEIQSMARCHVDILFQVDSCQMTPHHWLQIAQTIQNRKKNFDAFIVLHGTDTLAYTASALSLLLPSFRRPVILTGAQKPLATLRTDARRNLISAIEIATTGPRTITEGVHVFFDRTLFLGTSVSKRSATDFDAFWSPKSPPLAWVGTEIQYTPTAPPRTLRTRHHRSVKNTNFDEKIVVLQVSPLTSWAFWNQVQDWSEVSAVILRTYASGTAPTQNLDLMRLLHRLLAQKIPILLHTEATPHVQNYESTQMLLSLGCLDASAMTFENAWVYASWLLGSLNLQNNKTRSKRFAELWSSCT